MPSVTKSSTKEILWERIQELEQTNTKLRIKNANLRKESTSSQPKPKPKPKPKSKPGPKDPNKLTKIEETGELDPQFHYGGFNGRAYPPDYDGPMLR